VCVCVCVSCYVCACVFGNSLCVGQWSRTSSIWNQISDMCLTRKQIKGNKCEIYKNSCMWVHKTDVCQQPSLSRQKAKIHDQILKKKYSGDDKWWLITLFPFLAPWPSRPPAKVEEVGAGCRGYVETGLVSKSLSVAGRCWQFECM